MSPAARLIGMRSPAVVRAPGPTEMTSPSFTFVVAASGRKMPPAVWRRGGWRAGGGRGEKERVRVSGECALCVCVCVCERVRERESVCVCVREREREAA